MNILFLTSRFPYPPNRGDKVRTFQFLKAFSRKNSVYLFSLIEKDDDYFKELEDLCSNIKIYKLSKIKSLFNLFLNIFHKKPFQVAYYSSKKAEKELIKYIEKNNIDIVYTHLIRMAPYAENINARKIIDYTDAISMEYKRSLPYINNKLKKIFFKIETDRTAKYEKKIHEKFDDAWFISSTDLKYLDISSEKINIIPNPVKLQDCKKDYRFNNKLTFVGNLSVPHNINAVEFVHSKIMPDILKDHPEIEFQIIGADPTDSIRAMHGKLNTKVLGFVENLWEALRESDVFLAPMFFSAGVQNKVIEAMSVGLPVITTENVANSITAEDSKHLIVASDKESFVDAINILINDLHTRQAIGFSGREKINQIYGEDVILSLLDTRIAHFSKD